MLNLALSTEVGYLSPMREAAYLVMPVLIAVDVGDLDLVAQLERGVDGGVAEAAARIALGLEAALDDVVAPAKLVERLEGDLDAAVEGVEIAGHRIFQRRRAGGEAVCGRACARECRCGRCMPECSGLVMVPKLADSPPDSDAAMPRMSGMASRGTFIRRAQAMAAPDRSDAAHGVPAADRGLLGRGAREASDTLRSRR